jgi:hypothetical protein
MKTRLFPFLLVLCCSTAIFAQTTFQNVVAHYPLDGNANDVSSNSFNGVVSGAILTTDRFGAANSAYQFDGTDDYIITSDGIDNYLNNGASFSAWINIAESHSGRILSNYNGEGWPGDCESRIGFVFTVTSNRELALYYLIDGNDWVGRKTDVGSLNANNWHHVAGVWDGTFSNAAFSLYIDGVRRDTFDFDNGTVDCGGYLESVNPFHIGMGHCQSGPCLAFLGKIDNVRIFDTPIDLLTVNELYNETSQSISTLMDGSGHIKIFPNPTQDIITISIDEATFLPGSKIEILDICSRVILSEKINSSQTQINMKDVASNGLYYLQVVDGNSSLVYSAKIMVQ